jgi:Lipocalin-like domain
MKKLIFLTLFTILVFTCPFGQNNSKGNKIIGTWRLIEFADLDSATGIWKYPYGKNPKGYFTYTKNNIVNLNISSEVPLKISEDSAKKLTINLYDYIWQNSFGYFGTYSIDFKKSIITHHVKGGCIPYYIDTDQQRPFILKGDTLIIGDNKTWKRVLVKAD